MKDSDYVSSEVANLLREKGYDEPSRMVLSNLNGRCLYAINVNIHDLSQGSILIPSLYDAQKWLREKYKLSLEIGLTYEKQWMCTLADIQTGKDIDECPNLHGYNSYEEALNEGIKMALKYI